MMNFENDIQQCVKTLEAGGTILYPTDTIWGIGCDATNKNAVQNIIALKQRAANKSFVVLVNTKEEVLKYAPDADPAIFDYLSRANDPTTVIYEHAAGLAENVLAENGSVAMRICTDEFCRQLIKRLGKPVVSTSANISGEHPPFTFSHISEEIKEGVDFIVSYKQHDETARKPSSIIKWVDGKILIVRS